MITKTERKIVTIGCLSEDLPGNFTEINIEQMEMGTFIKLRSDDLTTNDPSRCKNITLEFKDNGLQIKKWRMGKKEEVIAKIPASKIYFKK